jgi:tyrosine-protein kinase Etk/Wzc
MQIHESVSLDSQSASGRGPAAPAWLEAGIVLAKRKWLIAGVTVLFAAGSAVTALLLPVLYTARAKILLPQQTASVASTMMGQLGALAALGGKDIGLKDPADIYVTILGSRSIADAVIRRFDLMKVYGKQRMVDCRETLSKRAEITVDKGSVISIAVDDQDPKRAAAIANAFFEELGMLMRRLAVTEISQRRLFFEREVESVKASLAAAESALKELQQSSGLIQPDAQARATIEGYAGLRAQIAAKQVELSAMRQFATEQNPDYTLAKEQLSALRDQLRVVQKQSSLGDGDLSVPTREIPKASLGYVRRLRDVKYFEALYEVLGRQYEAAKVDEARDAVVIQTLDSALEPEKKTKPNRRQIVLGGAAAGLVLGLFLAFLRETRDRLLANPIAAARWRAFQSHLLGRAATKEL